MCRARERENWMNSPRVILVIDDSRLIRQVAQVALARVDTWQVLTVESGHEGLELAAREQPDVVLLDAVMPDLDGPATLRLLRQAVATRDIPVVFLTGKSEDDDRRRFEALGATAVIAKPFDPQTLPEQVASALGWSE
jgi:CheY-like chemotaxis protein